MHTRSFFVIWGTKFPFAQYLMAHNNKIAQITLHGGVGIRKLSAEGKSVVFPSAVKSFKIRGADCSAPYKYYCKIAFILLIPAETFSCLAILNTPSSPVFATCGPPQISLENLPIE